MSTDHDDGPVVLPDDPALGPEVQVDYPGYRSTRWRAPGRPLAPLPEEFHDLAGPVFDERGLDRHDGDLTRQFDGEPLGERIVVTGRVTDTDGRPIRSTLVEVWQANAAGRYAHVDDHPAPLDPNFQGGRACADRRRGPLPLRHDQAGRVPVGEPRERVAPGAHPLLALRARVHRPAGHADVLPGRPALRLRPDPPVGARPARPRAPRLAFDLDTTVPVWALGYRFDIVVGATPTE